MTIPVQMGGANGVGVNANGCADIFVLDQNVLNFPFLYPDPDDLTFFRQYFFSIFELTSGINNLPPAACAAVGVSPPCLGFRTPEEANTTVQFTSVITTEPVSVPEPTTVLLVGLAGGSETGLITPESTRSLRVFSARRPEPALPSPGTALLVEQLARHAGHTANNAATFAT